MLFSLQPEPTPSTISVDVALADFLTYSFSIADWTCMVIIGARSVQSLKLIMPVYAKPRFTQVADPEAGSADKHGQSQQRRHGCSGHG